MGQTIRFSQEARQYVDFICILMYNFKKLSGKNKRFTARTGKRRET